MNVEVWILLPVAGLVCAALAAVLIVSVALRGCASGDRAGVLRAAAEVVRAVRGKR